MKVEFLIPLIAVAGLLFVWFKSRWIIRQDAGNDRMKKIAGYIQKGALSFLKTEHKVLSVFVIIVAVLVAVTANPNSSHALIAFAFIIGASLSALAGFIGMSIATKANVRTTNAARTSISKALDISFAGGTVMGISVASLGVLGLRYY